MWNAQSRLKPTQRNKAVALSAHTGSRGGTCFCAQPPDRLCRPTIRPPRSGKRAATPLAESRLLSVTKCPQYAQPGTAVPPQPQAATSYRPLAGKPLPHGQSHRKLQRSFEPLPNPADPRSATWPPRAPPAAFTQKPCPESDFTPSKSRLMPSARLDRGLRIETSVPRTGLAWRSVVPQVENSGKPAACWLSRTHESVSLRQGRPCGVLNRSLLSVPR